MRVTIFDYGAGNLHSLAKGLARVSGVEVQVETDPARAVDTDALVLPGVGAFGLAAERLAPGREAVRGAAARGLPVLGICLGMQLLFDASDEGAGAGLGLIAGRVVKLPTARVPQIGWNRIDDAHDPLFARSGLEMAYYANSYVCRPSPEAESRVTAWSTHETARFPAAVRAGSVVGVQFHPEKSSAAGLRLLAAFLEEART